MWRRRPVLSYQPDFSLLFLTSFSPSLPLKGKYSTVDQPQQPVEQRRASLSASVFVIYRLIDAPMIKKNVLNNIYHQFLKGFKHPNEPVHLSFLSGS